MAKSTPQRTKKTSSSVKKQSRETVKTDDQKKRHTVSGKGKGPKKLSSGQKEAMYGNIDAAAMDLRSHSVHKNKQKKEIRQEQIAHHKQKKAVYQQQQTDMEMAMAAIQGL